MSTATNSSAPVPQDEARGSALTIARKLTAGLSVFAVLSASVGALGLYFISSIDTTLNHITDVVAPTVEVSSDLTAVIWKANKVAEEIVADEDLTHVGTLSQELDQLNATFATTFAELESLVDDPSLHDDMQLALREHEAFVRHSDEMVRQHRLELEEEATASELIMVFDEAGAKLVAMLDAFASESEKQMRNERDRGDQLLLFSGAKAEDINAILGDLFETEYPVVEAALKLQRIVVEMQDTAGEYLAPA